MKRNISNFLKLKIEIVFIYNSGYRLNVNLSFTVGTLQKPIDVKIITKYLTIFNGYVGETFYS